MFFLRRFCGILKEENIIRRFEMSMELLEKEAEGLSEQAMAEVLDFILFLKTRPGHEKYTSPQGRVHKRQLGVFENESFYMADDFDETPDSFKEYI